MKPLKKVFIYPITDLSKSDSRNPYIFDLVSSLDKRAFVVNSTDSNKMGIIDAYRYFFKSDQFIFNWVENIRDRKLGYIQSLLFILLVPSLKIFGKQITFVLHNKKRHNKSNLISEMSVLVIMVFCNRIITHSHEGIEFISRKFKFINLRKVKYVPHPYNYKEIIKEEKNNYSFDFVIWGKISRYKGVLEFLSYLNNEKKNNKYRIAIVGKCSEKNYCEEIKKLSNPNIFIDLKYYTEAKLSEIISISRVILFLYKDDSILGTGALVQSMRFGKPIIASNFAMFKDYFNEGLISVFNDYEEIFELYESNKLIYDYSKSQSYIEINSWNNLIGNYLL